MPVAPVVVLRIFFFGLMAFVQQKNQLTVVLADSSHPPSVSECSSQVAECPFHQHKPLLMVSRDSLRADLQASCPLSEIANVCAWKLTKKDLTIPAGTTNLSYKGGRGGIFSKARLPSNQGDFVDFSWVPAMSDIQPSAAQLDARSLMISASAVAALIRMSKGQVRTCHLAELEFDGSEPVERSCAANDKTINVFRFESVDGKVAGSSQQALADGVMVYSDIAVPAAGINLTLDASQPILLTNGTQCVIDGKVRQCVDVAITNMPPHAEECPGVAVDFALLYDLSTTPSKGCDRLIPHRTPECHDALPESPECSSSLIDALQQGMASTSPDSRPVCPMVSFGG